MSDSAANMSDLSVIRNPGPVSDAPTEVAAPRVGYVEAAVGGPERASSLASLFPGVAFVNLGAWPDRHPADLTAMIVSADATEVETVLKRLVARPGGPKIIIVLRDANVTATRWLLRAGAAAVLSAPVGEAALALSVQRILGGAESAQVGKAPDGRIVAMLKAGGGVGATAIGTQVAAILAGRGDPDIMAHGGVCFADLDLQFGQGALVLDLDGAITVTDILEGGGPLDEAPLASALAAHRSGARLLASPREMMPLDTLVPAQVDNLLTALKRNFAVSILDLPTVWADWTIRALQLCDRIVVVTNLTVAQTNLVKRQLRMMSAQRMDAIPVTIVCNRVTEDQKGLVSVKAAEKAIGRAFDVIIPDDRKLMNDAIAQGREVASLRRGSKLEKALIQLADVIAPPPATAKPARRW
jgi:pilus assembly protein CpaE